MAKYHFNSKGETGLCRARTKCPFGIPLEDHFKTEDEARKAYESTQKVSISPLQKHSDEIPNMIELTPEDKAKFDEAWNENFSEVLKLERELGGDIRKGLDPRRFFFKELPEGVTPRLTDYHLPLDSQVVSEDAVNQARALKEFAVISNYPEELKESIEKYAQENNEYLAYTAKNKNGDTNYFFAPSAGSRQLKEYHDRKNVAERLSGNIQRLEYIRQGALPPWSVHDNNAIWNLNQYKRNKALLEREKAVFDRVVDGPDLAKEVVKKFENFTITPEDIDYLPDEFFPRDDNTSKASLKNGIQNYHNKVDFLKDMKNSTGDEKCENLKESLLETHLLNFKNNNEKFLNSQAFFANRKESVRQSREKAWYNGLPEGYPKPSIPESF